jgi:hypothetical protein
MFQNLTDRARGKVSMVARSLPWVKITLSLRAVAVKGGKARNRVVPGPRLWHGHEGKRRLKQQRENTQPRAPGAQANGSDRQVRNPCHIAPPRNCRISAAMSLDRVIRG